MLNPLSDPTTWILGLAGLAYYFFVRWRSSVVDQQRLAEQLRKLKTVRTMQSVEQWDALTDLERCDQYRAIVLAMIEQAGVDMRDIHAGLEEVQKAGGAGPLIARLRCQRDHLETDRDLCLKELGEARAENALRAGVLERNHATPNLN